MYWLRSAVGVVLVVLAEQLLEGAEAGDILGRQFLAHDFAQGVVVGGGNVGVVAGGVDGSHHGEEGGTGVELALFGCGGLGGQGHQEDSR